MAYVTIPLAIAAGTDAAISPFKKCAADNNITLPAKGSGTKLSQGDRDTIKDCMKIARKAAFEKCATDGGFTPGQGQKPTADQRKAIHACMKAQGFKKHGRGKRGGCHRHKKDGDNAPAVVPAPAVTPAQ